MKVTKRYANYRPKDEPRTEKRCGHCASMNSDGSCKKVEGQVTPEYVCDLWSRPRGS